MSGWECECKAAPDCLHREPTPNPGSPEAVDDGCRCDPTLNADGAGVPPSEFERSLSPHTLGNKFTVSKHCALHMLAYREFIHRDEP